MGKQVTRLNEAQLHKVIEEATIRILRENKCNEGWIKNMFGATAVTESNLNESISNENILSELDWKTYANAARQRKQQYRDNPENKELWDKSYELNQMANQRFDDDYVGDMKYDTVGDKIRGKKSPTFSAKFDSSKEDRMPYGAVNGRNKGGDKLFSTEKGTYHSSKGITSPRQFFRDAEVADKFTKANDELWDYHNGNYTYDDVNGWHLKNK